MGLISRVSSRTYRLLDQLYKFKPYRKFMTYTQTKIPHISMFVVGTVVGVSFETVLTFFKVPWGRSETFYDYTRRKDSAILHAQAVEYDEHGRARTASYEKGLKVHEELHPRAVTDDDTTYS